MFEYVKEYLVCYFIFIMFINYNLIVKFIKKNLIVKVIIWY